MNLVGITEQVQRALEGLMAVARLRPRDIVVVGCSTSEVMGERIGKAGSLEVAEAILDGLLPTLRDRGLYLAVQCCEHLNRALVVERECAERYNLELVTVVPHPKAGGALAAAAMKSFSDPAVAESIAAHAGIDIGDTFIGMHLKRVAVPVRLDIDRIGEAHLTLARTRPKLLGGALALYPEFC